MLLEIVMLGMVKGVMYGGWDCVVVVSVDMFLVMWDGVMWMWCGEL